jgi:hypothetical protein
MNVPGTNPATMDQSARLLWYHDHAIGITRTNAYSGIASALVLVDDFEIGLEVCNFLPFMLKGKPDFSVSNSFLRIRSQAEQIFKTTLLLADMPTSTRAAAFP